MPVCFFSGDLANLDGLDSSAAAKLPALMALKKALYSDKFRCVCPWVCGLKGDWDRPFTVTPSTMTCKNEEQL